MLVIVSIAAGALIGSAATRVGLIEGEPKWKYYGALLLTVAICSHHFTAMGAASIMPDPRIAVSETAIPTGWLAVAVALASLAILLLACCGLALDIRDRRRLEQEKDRMRGLANAAAEGPVVCDGADDRDSKPQFCGPHRRPPRNWSRDCSCHRSCPTKRCERDCLVIPAK